MIYFEKTECSLGTIYKWPLPKWKSYYLAIGEKIREKAEGGKIFCRVMRKMGESCAGYFWMWEEGLNTYVHYEESDMSCSVAV